jgi:hypothetical protein
MIFLIHINSVLDLYIKYTDFRRLKEYVIKYSFLTKKMFIFFCHEF